MSPRKTIFGPTTALAVRAALAASLLLTLMGGLPAVSGSSLHIIWLSPRAFVVGQNIAGGHLTLSSPSGDEQQVTTDTVGDLQWVDYPIQISNQLKIKQVVTCYKDTARTSFISQVRLSTSTVPPTATVVYDDPTDLRSTSGTCRNGMVVSWIPVNGEITLSLRLNFGSTSDAIDIGAIGIVTN